MATTSHPPPASPCPSCKETTLVHVQHGRCLHSKCLTCGYKHVLDPKAFLPCFVATCVYGSSSHPDVVRLRTFRDTVLVTSRVGRIAIRAYNALGPYAAEAIGRSALCKSAIRSILRKVVGVI